MASDCKLENAIADSPDPWCATHHRSASRCVDALTAALAEARTEVERQHRVANDYYEALDSCARSDAAGRRTIARMQAVAKTEIEPLLKDLRKLLLSAAGGELVETLTRASLMARIGVVLYALRLLDADEATDSGGAGAASDAGPDDAKRGAVAGTAPAALENERPPTSAGSSVLAQADAAGLGEIDVDEMLRKVGREAVGDGLRLPLTIGGEHLATVEVVARIVAEAIAEERERVAAACGSLARRQAPDQLGTFTHVALNSVALSLRSLGKPGGG